MMTNNPLLKIIVTLILLVNLAACNTTGVKSDTGSGQTEETDLLALRSQADTAYLNGDLVSSAEAYETLIKEMPEEALHWFRLANIYARTNRPQAAINLYREAILREPKYARAWFNLSIVQLKQTAYSLNEMLLYTDKNDPMYIKAKDLLDGIQSIIKQE